jgi:hypothetical protein
MFTSEDIVEINEILGAETSRKWPWVWDGYSEVERVRPRQLLALQRHRNRRVIDAYLIDARERRAPFRPPRPGEPRVDDTFAPRLDPVWPLVIRLDGRLVLLDGHHRRGAARKARTWLWVRVLDLDELASRVPRYHRIHVDPWKIANHLDEEHPGAAGGWIEGINDEGDDPTRKDLLLMVRYHRWLHRMGINFDEHYHR